jgi:hypothetical protein
MTPERSLAQGSVETAIRELARHRGVAVVKEERLAAIHRRDAGHVGIGELKIEDVHVLLHPLRANGLLDDHHTALDQPTQNDLRGGLAVTPISVSVGSVKRLFRPSANGPHDSICMPWSLINRCSAVR